MIYFIHKDNQFNYIWNFNGLFEELIINGVKILSEKEFNELNFNDSDTIVVFISFEHQSSKEKLRNLQCHKYIYVIDESKSDGILFRTVYELLNQIDCKNVIITFPSKRNIEDLQSHGLHVLKCPLSIKSLRPRKEKKYDILISGQLDNVAYPVRTQIFNLFSLQKKKV